MIARRPGSLAPAVTAAALLWFAASGCSSSGDGGPPDELYGFRELSGFRLSGGGTVTVADPSRYTLELFPSGEARIRSDCNRCGGPYAADDEMLVFDALACTLAACGPDSQDQRFEAALRTAGAYRIDAGALEVDYDGGTMVFTAPPPSR